MLHRITVLPGKQNIEAPSGSNLLSILQTAGLAPNAPCGGAGTCGKCKVTADAAEVLACRTIIDRDMTVTVPNHSGGTVLTDGIHVNHIVAPVRDGYLLAFDIGTTTVAGYLLDGSTGQELATEIAHNPQIAFGADVISRIGHALNGKMDKLVGSIRHCLEEMTTRLCETAHIAPSEIGVISVVGNPCMRQLFLGIRPDNLAKTPFPPVLTELKILNAADHLACCSRSALLVIPDIAGYVGADTVACVLATKLDQAKHPTLLVDIGTNGEMVLTDGCRMVACATAAGPALEGANIHFGVRAEKGAIDHVWVENGALRHTVIGCVDAIGICGSGLIDAVAAAVELGLINSRGRILNSDRIIHLTPDIWLTQEDIRQVQLAKGAIAAGIELMTAHLGLVPADINQVYLAGAFGTYMAPASACKIGLLPPVLQGKITAVGNAAGSGAKILACDSDALAHAQRLTDEIFFLELASLPDFQRSFAKNMRF